jgi:ABC-2 type transport system permease protein
VNRVAALLGKELADLRRHPGIFFPAVLMSVLTVFIPLFTAVFVPYFAGERLSDSSDFRVALEMYRDQPWARTLDPEGVIQAWVFQQFLLLLVLTPIAGSMSVAAYTVIGEKQARTLEPLLATPITTFELLAAKVLAAFIPAVALSMAGFALYLAGIVLLAQPGVAVALFDARSLIIVFILGPVASLAALQLAVCVSSRVNDARSAQQLGALIILPITGLLIAQLTGNIFLTPTMLLLIAGVFMVANAALMRLGMALFDRESILTRWK